MVAQRCPEQLTTPLYSDHGKQRGGEGGGGGVRECKSETVNKRGQKDVRWEETKTGEIISMKYVCESNISMLKLLKYIQI